MIPNYGPRPFYAKPYRKNFIGGRRLYSTSGGSAVSSATKRKVVHKRKTPRPVTRRAFDAAAADLRLGDFTVAASAASTSFVRAMGDYHHITGQMLGTTSLGGANQPLSFRFHSSLQSFKMSQNGGWHTNVNNPGGTGVLYGTDFINREKYFLDYIDFSIIMKQAGERAKIRISMANPKRRIDYSGTRLESWQHDPYSLGQDEHFWDVIATKHIQFEQPLATFTALKSVQKTEEVRFRWNIQRWFKSRNGVQPIVAGDWDDAGWNNQVFVVIDSDDATEVDGAHINVEVKYNARFFFGTG